MRSTENLRSIGVYLYLCENFDGAVATMTVKNKFISKLLRQERHLSQIQAELTVNYED